MDSIVSGLYNFVATTVVPAVTEQATNLVGGATALAGGAAHALTQMSQTALEWGSGSEDATASSDVFSWEQQENAPSIPSEPKTEEEAKVVRQEQAGTSSANTSIEWEVVQENPDETGPVKHNQFEIVQNDYAWMKNSN
ncbi:hypothetical protein GCK72_002582 [Caenorhabditis remanei]|uniref:Uncharacterized protein n=1 Tax=Caenorhabditis remanei TaxID=31234 RepID=E3LVF9_CAERE|nr:hypothetical protein GCK72_002582 [Caenorhabditis remanei]EFP12480.1 hypothetical protein CRE_29731 [Caenorhabditis remanei]KAF1770759.1 hypothetical protein GCK72_002582 [Caenorhabditis remanei]